MAGSSGWLIRGNAGTREGFDPASHTQTSPLPGSGSPARACALVLCRSQAKLMVARTIVQSWGYDMLRKFAFLTALFAFVSLLLIGAAEAAAKKPQSCGGILPFQCPAGQFCQFPTGACT